jgi:hypothetical protein
MTSVDRLGFHLRPKTAEAMKGARVAFLVKSARQQTPEKCWWKWCSKPVAPNDVGRNGNA